MITLLPRLISESINDIDLNLLLIKDPEPLVKLLLIEPLENCFALCLNTELPLVKLSSSLKTESSNVFIGKSVNILLASNFNSLSHKLKIFSSFPVPLNLFTNSFKVSSRAFHFVDFFITSTLGICKQKMPLRKKTC